MFPNDIQEMKVQDIEGGKVQERNEIEWLAENNWIATTKDKVAWYKLEEAFI